MSRLFANTRSARSWCRSPARIAQFRFNIVNNASESIGEENGLVSVFTGEMQCDEQYFKDAFSADGTPEGAYVFIEVSDNGCGMDQQTIAKIFDPFFSTKFAGRGLGLAAVLGIVRGHRGVLKVYSEPGSGTTMKVLFPASDQPAITLAVAPADTHDYRGTETVLVVDDDQTVLDVTKDMLENHGFQVQTATDGFEAIDRFQKSSDTIDVVILDLTMPRMGGEEALRGLRRIRADVPVILVSGYNEQEVSNRFVGKGLAGFIQKPFQTSTLISTLRGVLGK